MNFEDSEQPISNNDEPCGMHMGCPPTLETPAAMRRARREPEKAALLRDHPEGSILPSVSLAHVPGHPSPPALSSSYFYIPAVPIRHLEGVLLEQLQIYHRKIQRAVDRIPEESILTQQLIGDVWRGRVFLMGFFRAIEYILAASRPEWSFFDTRARLHYKVHDARWEADQAANDAIQLIAARRGQRE